MCGEEALGHESGGRRPDGPGPAAPRARAEEVRDPGGDSAHAHRGDPPRSARVREHVPLLVEEPPRDPEERLHQDGVLVVDAPCSVDRALAECLAGVVEEEAPPADVVDGGAEVDALVTRYADGARRGEQPRDVRGSHRGADEVVAPPDARRETQGREPHRVPASKQYMRRSPAWVCTSASRSTSRPAVLPVAHSNA